MGAQPVQQGCQPVTPTGGGASASSLNVLRLRPPSRCGATTCAAPRGWPPRRQIAGAGQQTAVHAAQRCPPKSTHHRRFTYSTSGRRTTLGNGANSATASRWWWQADHPANPLASTKAPRHNHDAGTPFVRTTQRFQQGLRAAVYGVAPGRHHNGLRVTQGRQTMRHLDHETGIGLELAAFEGTNP